MGVLLIWVLLSKYDACWNLFFESLRCKLYIKMVVYIWGVAGIFWGWGGKCFNVCTIYHSEAWGYPTGMSRLLIIAKIQ